MPIFCQLRWNCLETLHHVHTFTVKEDRQRFYRKWVESSFKQFIATQTHEGSTNGWIILLNAENSKFLTGFIFWQFPANFWNLWCHSHLMLTLWWPWRLSAFRVCAFSTIFTARQHSKAMQSAVLAMIDSVWPSVWPSDRPSQSGIMPKRLQLRSCSLHWWIAPWL